MSLSLSILHSCALSATHLSGPVMPLCHHLPHQQQEMRGKGGEKRCSSAGTDGWQEDWERDEHDRERRMKTWWELERETYRPLCHLSHPSSSVAMVTGFCGYSNMASSWSARSSNMLPMSSRMLTVVFCSATELNTHTESQHYNGTAYVLVERLAVKCANPAVQILYLFTVVVPLEMSVLAQHIMWQWWQIHIKILCNYWNNDHTFCRLK